jgi:hypothetical protein
MDFKYFLEQSTDFFKDAEEYFHLRRKFQNILPWIDMLMSPLVIVVTFLVYGTLDMLSLLGLIKSVNVFREWMRYRHLSRQIREWKEIVNQRGGPTISTNDPEYHIFVYADGMQRIHNSYFKSVSHRNH